MGNHGDLMSVRPDIRVFDATLRDGGLVNNFEFTDEFVKALYEMNVKAGVDYMEMGYRASKQQFNPSEFGKWKFSSDEDIRAIVGDNDTDLKLAIMADVDRCDYKTDIVESSESPLDMIRVATYLHQMPGAIAMIEDADKKGYETTCNIMAVSNLQESDLEQAIKELAQTPIKALYIVDSYGSLYPEQVQKIADFYMKYMEPAGKFVGIHAHNNQQCAFANTIGAIQHGVSFADGTVCGMGRGAGNCSLEGLIGFFKNPKYRLEPVLGFIEKYMLEMKKTCTWGYDIPYMLTGLTFQHPRTAIAAVANNDTQYVKQYQMLGDMD